MSTKERLDILKERLDDLFNENQRLKELCDRYEEEHNTIFEEWKKTINIINELEKYICDLEYESISDTSMWRFAVIIHNKLKELKGENNE